MALNVETECCVTCEIALGSTNSATFKPAVATMDRRALGMDNVTTGTSARAMWVLLVMPARQYKKQAMGVLQLVLVL